MSEAAARAYINKVIQSRPEWKGLRSVREAMNTTNIHSLDLSFSVFKENNNYTKYSFAEDTDLRYFHNTLKEVLHSIVPRGYIFKTVIDAKPQLYRERLLDLPGKCLLISSGDTLKILGYDYDSVRKLLSKAIKSSQFLDSSPLGRRIAGRVDPDTGEILGGIKLQSKLHLGHTGLETPLSETIRVLLAEVSSNPTTVSDLNSILGTLASTQAFLSYSHINKSNNSKLGPSIVELVVQPEDLNLNISNTESRLYRDLLISIRKHLAVAGIPGSNTLKQDIVQFVFDRVLEGLTGKPQKNIKPHTSAKGTLKSPAKATSNPVRTYKQPLPQLRTVRGQFYSLASLQRLLDANLAQKIKDNMGDGTRRDILNLRSGRFAESVKVERMSQSREGMITAFYTYMKNPYQTFEPGFRQGSPNSRNPKLLISKSIREIAATQVANRMRAVLV